MVREPTTCDLRLGVLGAGQQGFRYARVGRENGLRVAVVAETDDYRRELFVRLLGDDGTESVGDWRAMDLAGQGVDAYLVTMHVRERLEAMGGLFGSGTPMLLEKPVALDPAGLRRFRDAAAAVSDGENTEMARSAVAYPLRHAGYTEVVREVIRSGEIGEVLNVDHFHGVSPHHFAHSYVRGVWSDASQTGGILLEKACHDVDWLDHVMGLEVQRIWSVGGRRAFGPEFAPDGAGSSCPRCDVESSCMFSAPRIYQRRLVEDELWTKVLFSADVGDEADLRAELETSRYGRCVFGRGGDLLDNQVVGMALAGGGSVALTVTCAGRRDVRRTIFSGSAGLLECEGAVVRLTSYRDDRTRLWLAGRDYPPPDEARNTMAKAFFGAVRDGDSTSVRATPLDAVKSTAIALAACEAQRSGAVIDVEKWRRRHGL